MATTSGNGGPDEVGDRRVARVVEDDALAPAVGYVLGQVLAALAFLVVRVRERRHERAFLFPEPIGPGAARPRPVNATWHSSPAAGRHIAREACSVHGQRRGDRKSTRLNSSHEWISYAVFCLKKK